ncbi:NUDIX domain-containing protein [Candidatus Pacearchaeota archaeon]|nr:NUDIX domain-containing protein [Candidatus Pacearchaeota archaeon]
MGEIKFAPRGIFEQILEWAVIPTFDLLIEYGSEGFIIVKRKIPPYENQWALPGLRMYKGEEIEDTLKRIALNELGLKIDPEKRTFLGQYVGKFKTEKERQDISTGFLIKIDKQDIKLNADHFSEYKITKTIPENMGAMYKYYISQYNKN